MTTSRRPTRKQVKVQSWAHFHLEFQFFQPIFADKLLDHAKNPWPVGSKICERCSETIFFGLTSKNFQIFDMIMFLKEPWKWKRLHFIEKRRNNKILSIENVPSWRNALWRCFLTLWCSFILSNFQILGNGFWHDPYTVEIILSTTDQLRIFVQFFLRRFPWFLSKIFRSLKTVHFLVTNKGQLNSNSYWFPSSHFDKFPRRLISVWWKIFEQKVSSSKVL